MLKSANKFIEEWNQRTSERSKLQHAYVALAVTTLVVAGLVGLVDYDTGQKLVALAMVCAGVFIVNAIAWALLSGLVLVRINGGLPAKATSKKPTKKTK